MVCCLRYVILCEGEDPIKLMCFFFLCGRLAVFLVKYLCVKRRYEEGKEGIVGYGENSARRKEAFARVFCERKKNNEYC